MRSAAISWVPEPQNGSNTRSRGPVKASSTSSTSATGNTAGCAQSALVAHDPEHDVRDTVALDSVAVAGLAMDCAVGPTQAAAERFARVLAFDRLVRFAGLAVEVEDELVRRGEAAVPVAGQAGPLVPDIPAEASPALRAHPGNPAFPIGELFSVAMDEAKVHQQLGICGDGCRGKDTLHQSIPITDLFLRRAIVALLGIGRGGEHQRRLRPVHQPRHHGRVGRITADQPVMPEPPDVAGLSDRLGRGLRDGVGGVIVDGRTVEPS